MTDESTIESGSEKDADSEKVKQDSRSDNPSVTRTKVRKDALEELADIIVERAGSAHQTLRTVLAGTVEIFVKDRPFRAVFDFVANPPKRLASGAKPSDCIIECDERTLFRIHQGDLNPQLAMVSDKITIKGKSGLAVYFFNLLGD